jgi:hypothetical protein
VTTPSSLFLQVERMLDSFFEHPYRLFRQPKCSEDFQLIVRVQQMIFLWALCMY